MYNVKIDATGMRNDLAEIEQGNPRRNFVVPTLSAAVQVSNAFRMGAGLPMVRGPRSLPVGQTYGMAGGWQVTIEIQRLQPKGKA